MELTVEVHHEDAGYWAQITAAERPELREVATDARTLSELTAYLEDVIQIMLEDTSVRLVDPRLVVGTNRVTVSG